GLFYTSLSVVVIALLESGFLKRPLCLVEAAVLAERLFQQHLAQRFPVLADLRNPFLSVSGRPQVPGGKVQWPLVVKTDHSALHHPELPCFDSLVPWHYGLNAPMLLADLLRHCP